MKNIKFATVVAAIVGLMAASMTAFATHGGEIRQGGDIYTYNPIGIFSKTAAYTVVAADMGKELDVSCTSANIAITLPAISSLYSGAKSIKIKKTDATVYSVIVTPATGDTVGMESTRYLVKQNDYMVISTGPNNDWRVSFESPLVKEDYSVGSVELPNGVYQRKSMVFEGATDDAYETTVTVTDPTSDHTITIPDDGGTVSLLGANEALTGNKTFGVTTTVTITNGIYNRVYMRNVNGVTKKLKITALGNVSGIAP